MRSLSKLATGSWIDRCQQKGWPERSVIDEIVSNGCHVMPIGSKRESDENELEWRLSFSQAEQQIVYTMNHSRFMCYGFLKIFLKEVICSVNQDSLICYYYLKSFFSGRFKITRTAQFGVPKIHCLVLGYALNVCVGVFLIQIVQFFIPENNMCKDKIVDSSREALLS